jgi:hypothetical protein
VVHRLQRRVLVGYHQYCYPLTVTDHEPFSSYL